MTESMLAAEFISRGAPVTLSVVRWPTASLAHRRDAATPVSCEDAKPEASLPPVRR